AGVGKYTMSLRIIGFFTHPLSTEFNIEMFKTKLKDWAGIPIKTGVCDIIPARIGVNIFSEGDAFEVFQKHHIGYNIQTIKVTLIFFDLKRSAVHRPDFTKIRSSYYERANGAVVVFDLTNEETFEDVRYWWKELLKHLPEKIPTILLGNKRDLIESSTVTSEMGRNLAREWNIPYIETSAKTGANVYSAFYILTSMILERNRLINMLCPFCGNIGAYQVTGYDINRKQQVCSTCNNQISETVRRSDFNRLLDP
ncbi:MAG: GTP-binding protein, partial [Promethearchaeota archaeon]